MSELAEPWRTAAEQAGVRQTYRGIGEAAGGLSHVTVRRLIVGGRSSSETVRRVAKALGVEPRLVREWAGLPVSEWGDWNPPEDAQYLNPRARAALSELILAITQGGQSGAGQTPAEKSPDDGSGGELIEFPGAGPRVVEAARSPGSPPHDDEDFDA